MKILIVTAFFPPLNSIASQRPHSWAKYWSLQGHEVFVATPVTPKNENHKHKDLSYRTIHIPQWSIFSSLKSNYENEQKSKRVSFKSFIYKPFNWLRSRFGILNACRFPDLLDLWVPRAIKETKKIGPFDLVVSTSGPYSVHFVGNYLRRHGFSKKWIADFRDPWSDNHIYPGIFPLKYLEPFLERKVVEPADFITTVSIPIAKELQKRHGTARVQTIENGYEIDEFLSLPKELFFPQNELLRIVYTGTIYPEKQDPTQLFQALNALPSRPKIRIHFAGNCESIQTLIDKFEVRDLVILHGLVDRKTALHMQRDADYLLFLPWKDASKRGLLGGKIFDYIASHTPILSLGVEHLEEAQQFIIDTNSGYLFHSPEEIRSFLEDQLSKNQKPEKRMLSPVFEQQFSRRILAEKVLSLAK